MNERAVFLYVAFRCAECFKTPHEMSRNMMYCGNPTCSQYRKVVSYPVLDLPVVEGMFAAEPNPPEDNDDNS